MLCYELCIIKVQCIEKTKTKQIMTKMYNAMWLDRVLDPAATVAHLKVFIARMGWIKMPLLCQSRLCCVLPQKLDIELHSHGSDIQLQSSEFVF